VVAWDLVSECVTISVRCVEFEVTDCVKSSETEVMCVLCCVISW
jgi:hypothetical protein